MNNSYIIPLFIAGTLIIILFACSLIAFLIVHKQKQQAFQNEILQTRIEVQEHAMIGISKEIHDNIGQLLGLAHMNIKAGINCCTDSKQAKLLTNANELLEKAVNDSRNISHSLNSDIIKKMGLATILKNELDYITLSQDIKCYFETVGAPFSLTPEKELLVYRIAQEAIRNSIKYSQATLLTVSLQYNIKSNFKMVICDNGIGFDVNKTLASGGGIGLINMRERASLLNGTLDIHASIPKGCTITLNANIDNGRNITDKNSNS